MASYNPPKPSCSYRRLDHRALFLIRARVQEVYERLGDAPSPEFGPTFLALLQVIDHGASAFGAYLHLFPALTRQPRRYKTLTMSENEDGYIGPNGAIAPGRCYGGPSILASSFTR